jgi:SSS family solute:Na+ symporter
MQTLPALIFGLYSNWFRAPALLAGWAAGFLIGTWMAWTDGLKPLHTLAFGSASVTLYVGLIALAINIIVAVAVNLVVPARQVAPRPAQ